MLRCQLSRSSISVRDRIKRAPSITVLLALTPHGEVTGLLFSIESLRRYEHGGGTPLSPNRVSGCHDPFPALFPERELPPRCIVNSPLPFAPIFLSSRGECEISLFGFDQMQRNLMMISSGKTLLTYCQ
jgi:hypothetical protein